MVAAPCAPLPPPARGGGAAGAGALWAGCVEALEELAGSAAGPAGRAACRAALGGKGAAARAEGSGTAAEEVLRALYQLQPPPPTAGDAPALDALRAALRRAAGPAAVKEKAVERTKAVPGAKGRGPSEGSRPGGGPPTVQDPGEDPQAAAALARCEGLMQVGRFGEAEPLLRHLGQVLPRHPLPPFFRGCVDQQRGDFRSACGLYEAALELRPELLSARGNLVACLMDLGKFDAAAVHAELLTRIDGGNAGRWFLLGVVQMRAGDAAAAAQSYQRALVLNPAYMEAYVNLDSVLLKLGRLQECREWAQRAVAARFGFWEHALQRPPHFLPGLRSRPWWDPQQFAWARDLEANFGPIKQELLALLGASSGHRPRGMPAAWGSVGGRSKHDRSLVQAGDWKEFVLLGNSEKVGQNLSRVPVTAACLAKAPSVLQMAAHGVGETLFSVISPGTHLRPHCGSTNGRLTAHFGLVVPDGCEIRCGEEVRAWEEGKVIVFDDSYEHEVWHRGQGARIVLLINFWHPDVPPQARRPIDLNSSYVPS